MPDSCKSCGKPIFWAIFEKTDKKTPLDWQPVEFGNLVFVAPGIVRVVRDSEVVTTRRYVSHFATCPNAGKHRRAR